MALFEHINNTTGNSALTSVASKQVELYFFSSINAKRKPPVLLTKSMWKSQLVQHTGVKKELDISVLISENKS